MKTFEPIRNYTYLVNDTVCKCIKSNKCTDCIFYRMVKTELCDYIKCIDKQRQDQRNIILKPLKDFNKLTIRKEDMIVFKTI